MQKQQFHSRIEMHSKYIIKQMRR